MNFINFKTLQVVLKHPLISGSSIVFLGSFGASMFAYLFNLVMGRLLQVSEFGLLTALTSLGVLFGVFQMSLLGIFAKFSARYHASNDNQGFSLLFHSGFRFVFIFSGILVLLLLVSIPFTSTVLKVEDPVLLILIIFSIGLSVLYSFPAGMLQGELQFKTLSVLSILGPTLKLILSVVFIILGFKLIGVLFAIFLSSLLPLVAGMVIIRKRHRIEKSTSKHSPIFLNELKSYSIPFFFATLGLIIISHADILLVRFYFEPIISGQYAALSLMGKAIFYLTSPLQFVLFPLIAQKREKNENVLKTLMLAFALVTSISLAISFGYFLFPHLVLSVFFPSPEYQVLAQYLGPFSLFIILFSLVNLFNNYFLSIGKTGIYKINLLGAGLFILLFSFFHNSLYQVIGVLFVSSMFILFSYILYYLKTQDK